MDKNNAGIAVNKLFGTSNDNRLLWSGALILE